MTGCTVSGSRLGNAMNSKALTFFFAWLQVALVCLNTWQIANQKWIGALVVGFLISLCWTFNTQRAAFSNIWDKLIYASGACAGTGTGILIASWIY